MKIVKKIYLLRWWSWSDGVRPAGVRGCWFSSQMGSPPLGILRIEYSHSFQFFFIFFCYEILFFVCCFESFTYCYFFLLNVKIEFCVIFVVLL